MLLSRIQRQHQQQKTELALKRTEPNSMTPLDLERLATRVSLRFPIRQSLEHLSRFADFEYDYPESEEVALIEALTTRLEQELRTAKKEHLSVGEVLLPNGLTRRISQDMFLLGDSEPCGLRGCTLYINFEGDEVKRISTIKCDPTVPTTFELYLTLKQSAGGWNSFLPQFLK